MATKEDRIIRADLALLKKEAYYRGAYRSEMVLGVVLTALTIASGFRADLNSLSDVIMTSFLGGFSLLSFASAWVSGARLRHIASIKVYQKDNSSD